MPLRKVQSAVIADNAITSNKIAAGAVTAADLNSDVNNVINNVTVNTVFTGDSITIPAGTTAERPASPTEGMLRFNTTFSKLEQYDGSVWATIDSPPVIIAVSTASFVNSTDTITITGSNFSQNCQVILLANDGTEYTPSTIVRNSASSLTITLGSSLVTAGQTTGKDPFDVKVINAGGLSSTYSSQINYNPNPIWSTAAGSLSTLYDIMRSGFSTSVSASSLDPDDTISYSITSGSLPTGMSLNSSTGAITGTPNSVVSDTTFNFTITASNGSTASNRAFSITIKAPVKQVFNYTGSEQSFSIPSGLTKIFTKMWGAAGGTYYDGTPNNGQGGAGGYTETTFNVLENETALTVVVGSGSEYSIAPYGGAGSGTNGGCAGGGASAILSGSLSGLFTSSNDASVPTSTLTNLAGATQVIAVAGGGGGGGWYIYDNMLAGCGGGLTAGQATGGYWQPTGGSQTSGGTYFGASTASGKFRGSDVTAAGSGGSGGGGGGWYGGGSGYSSANTNSSGGGGSGFIGYTNGSISEPLSANSSYGSYVDTITRTNGSRIYTNSKCLRQADTGITPPNTSDVDWSSDIGTAGVIDQSKLNGGDGRVVIIY